MSTTWERREDGTVVLTVDHPPVNALPARAWHELAATIRAVGADEATRVLVLRAAGRGFNAGVDIKELAADGGHRALVEVNRGCAEAFAAAYECPVPVISAVHGYCLGGGIGLVANSDVIIAADDATFGLPEVDRGALGAATHLSRLVPHHAARALYYTGRTATAQELHRFGSVWRVVEPDRLLDAALELAAEIAAKDPRVVRMAKESFNGIDPVDVRRGYRYEQGFTFELTLAGAADRARRAFARGGGAET
ncbi:enoyl-CoA hydratase family protein [Saccharopolyspora cebuensis]|uniref:Enoyl-CoA hydratase family protein n=1 Tax=Saccharopolyspora cebuensis TaxID=418759 RepID=A0ABV4CK81_9PSEU